MGYDTDEVVGRLGDLLQLDVDAANAYSEAIQRVDDEDVRAALTDFQQDHQRHVSGSTRVIADFGARPPEARPDVEGLLVEGTTAMRASLDTEAALGATRTNEKTTNHAYESAQGLALHEDIRGVLRRGLEDERTHLMWIEERLGVYAGMAQAYRESR